MKPCWHRSSLFPSQSGRQESNLPFTAYQTVASPLGFGPNISALYGNRTRLTCSTDRLIRQLHHRASQSAWRESNPPVRHGEPVPGPLGHRRTWNTDSKGGRSRTLCMGFGVHSAHPGAHP